MVRQSADLESPVGAGPFGLAENITRGFGHELSLAEVEHLHGEYFRHAFTVGDRSRRDKRSSVPFLPCQ